MRPAPQTSLTERVELLWVVPDCMLLAGAGYLVLARFYNDNDGRVTSGRNPARLPAAAPPWRS